MLTVKFYRYENGVEVMHALSCVHYSHRVDPINSVTIITIYPGPTTQNGVEWNISGRTSDSFTGCYVENSAGKTIASYSYTDHPDKRG